MITAAVHVSPLPAVSGRRAGRLVERNAMVYRHSWIILVTGFFEPVLYLLGIGYGVGSLVGPVRADDGHVVSYAVFAAPALMASAAMNGAIFETTLNFFYKLKFAKLYDVVLSTPLGVNDVALGEIAWALIRGSAYSCGFLVLMAALGLVGSPWVTLALPAALLLGFAFASAATAVTTFVRRWTDFDLVQLVLLPLFLFSATFYPLSTYPGALQVVVQLTPLYHGVHLLRGLTTGGVSAGLLGDAAYLLAMGGVGLMVASHRLERLLLR